MIWVSPLLYNIILTLFFIRVYRRIEYCAKHYICNDCSKEMLHYTISAILRSLVVYQFESFPLLEKLLLLCPSAVSLQNNFSLATRMLSHANLNHVNCLCPFFNSFIQHFCLRLQEMLSANIQKWPIYSEKITRRTTGAKSFYFLILNTFQHL